MMNKNGVVSKILDITSVKKVVDLKIKKPSNFNMKGLRNLGSSLRDQGRQIGKGKKNQKVPEPV